MGIFMLVPSLAGVVSETVFVGFLKYLLEILHNLGRICQILNAGRCQISTVITETWIVLTSLKNDMAGLLINVPACHLIVH
jgi:hypothetical protein